MNRVMALVNERGPAAVESRDQFEQLYRLHVGEVHAYAAARVGRSQAEDITAEVFHAAARAARGGRPEVLTPAWLMTVVRNKVIDHWRRDQRRRAKLHLLWSGRESTEAGAVADTTVTREAVLTALDRMEQHHRLLLMMHYVDGINVPELAALIGKSVSATESALARARRTFKKYFAREETTDE